MAVAEFIGDAVSAAGYRLCGVETQVADAGNALTLINHACERAELVLISSSMLPFLRAAELDQLLAKTQPPVLIVPDVRGLHDVPDIASRINRQLGLLE
jgi:vacuolar-type H+-ATPase subunit F/Vma7